MAKGMKRERKNVDGLDKDIKNMEGAEDPGEQYLYLHCTECCLFVFCFPLAW